MAEPIRNDEAITTGDFAGWHGNPNHEAEAENQNPRGPQIVQTDLNESISSEVANNMPETRREWDTSRPTLDAVGTNQLAQETAPLFNETEMKDYRSRWSSVQAGFVDEPRRSVQEADQLVATVMQRLAEGFAHERASLEKQWGSGDNVSTEDLRVALRRYRAFFGRLLNAA